MHLQKLRFSSALHLPSTRQRHDGFHENQSETQISSLIFPTSVISNRPSKTALGKLCQFAAIAATFVVLTAPQVLCPPAAHAKPAAKPVGTWGRTTSTSTYVRIRPGTQTPIVAKVAKGTQLMIWGTYNGWYRVETTDNKFGWIHDSLVNVPLKDKLQQLSHVKAKQASDRTGNQTLYGDAAVLKKYYATYKAPGAKRGLELQGVSLAATPKPAAKQPAMPREVTITTAESTRSDAKTVEARVVTPVVRKVETAAPPKRTVVASRKAAKPRAARTSAARQVEATVLAPMPTTNLPQISPEDIMAARQAHIQRQLTSRRKTSPYIVKSAPNSAVKTAPALEPKVQPTAADDEIIGSVYYQVSAKKKPAAKKAAPSRGGSPRDYAAYAAKNGQLGSGMATQALSYRGMPYIRGASSPKRGFDCSGLIYYLLRSRGYNPPRTAAGFASYGAPVARKDLQTGDLVLFANTYKRGISHIGIYTGNNNFVHAANSRSGVKSDSLSSKYYASKYYGARRVPVKK